MKSLEICPVCKSQLINREYKIQICNVCGYWTIKGTARLDPAMIFT
ncbi:conserved hypothetical protein [Methanohalobium evestigatum Z-7303]|uniref:Uncharacterized protein n=1 Tax=Methanohalobium evestigatum (strain ATCC BAA-1072 / DSM 3721 / NBRC 107634 / OCM 161 / Z-7303) TaxID=644295 RepID=D7E8E9_METEZ|nr:hypothetical protein [Methanohalobium evestigatum]ADI73491.1 conserved hypothetical protein [Methanohalobium evestigatum Z-7303]